MQNQAAIARHPSHAFARRRNVNQDRLGFEKASKSDGIGVLDRGAVAELRQRPGGFAIALRWRSPVERQALTSRRDDVFAEARQTDIDHFERVFEKRGHGELPRPQTCGQIRGQQRGAISVR